MAAIKRLVIHCSDSAWGDAAVIRDWHRQRGWKDIGYNAVVLNGHRSSGSAYSPSEDGVLEIGRGLDFDKVLTPAEIGAHAMGYNAESIGVCLVGVRDFSAAQLLTLEAFCLLWMRIVPGIEVVGHCEVDVHGKTCPNMDMVAWRQRLRLRLEA